MLSTNNPMDNVSIMWLWPALIKEPAGVAHSAGLSNKLELISYGHNGRLLSSDAQVANHVLEQCSTDFEIAKKDTKIMKFTQPSTCYLLNLQTPIAKGIIEKKW